MPAGYGNNIMVCSPNRNPFSCWVFLKTKFSARSRDYAQFNFAVLIVGAHPVCPKVAHGLRVSRYLEVNLSSVTDSLKAEAT